MLLPVELWNAPRHSLRSCPRRDLIGSTAAERNPLGDTSTSRRGLAVWGERSSAEQRPNAPRLGEPSKASSMLIAGEVRTQQAKSKSRADDAVGGWPSPTQRCEPVARPPLPRRVPVLGTLSGAACIQPAPNSGSAPFPVPVVHRSRRHQASCAPSRVGPSSASWSVV